MNDLEKKQTRVLDNAVLNLKLFIPYCATQEGVFMFDEAAQRLIQITVEDGRISQVPTSTAIFVTEKAAESSNAYRRLKGVGSTTFGLFVTDLSLSAGKDLNVNTGIRFAVIKKKGRVTDNTDLFKASELGDKIIEITYNGDSFSESYDIKPVSVAVRQVTDVSVI